MMPDYFEQGRLQYKPYIDYNMYIHIYVYIYISHSSADIFQVLPMIFKWAWIKNPVLLVYVRGGT